MNELLEARNAAGEVCGRLAKEHGAAQKIWFALATAYARERSVVYRKTAGGDR